MKPDEAYMAQFRPLIDACREAIHGLKLHNVDAAKLLVCAEEWPNAEGLTVLGVPVVLRSFGRGWVDAHGPRESGFGLRFTAPIGEIQEGGVWPRALFCRACADIIGRDGETDGKCEACARVLRTGRPE